MSEALREMFPDRESLISSKLVTRQEIDVLEREGELGRIWWIPISWTMTMIRSTKEKQFIPIELKVIIESLAEFQAKLERVESYDHIIIPPMYKQVVKCCVVVYFILQLIGSQELDEGPQMVFPMILILKFIFFYGWLKVAEAIQNPFGKDEDDFQVCALVARHIWAIGKNLNQIPGPPNPVEDGKDDIYEDDSSLGVA